MRQLTYSYDRVMATISVYSGIITRPESTLAYMQHPCTESSFLLVVLHHQVKDTIVKCMFPPVALWHVTFHTS